MKAYETNGAVLPSLSRVGILTNPKTILLKCFENFLVSDYSQSTTFIGEVVSLKYILATNKEVSEIKSSIISNLEKMYLNYFKSVIVNVTDNDSENNSVVQYSIDISVTDYTDKTHALSEIISTTGSNINNFDILMNELKNQRSL